MEQSNLAETAKMEVMDSLRNVQKMITRLYRIPPDVALIEMHSILLELQSQLSNCYLASSPESKLTEEAHLRKEK